MKKDKKPAPAAPSVEEIATKKMGEDEMKRRRMARPVGGGTILGEADRFGG